MGENPFQKVGKLTPTHKLNDLIKISHNTDNVNAPSSPCAWLATFVRHGAELINIADVFCSFNLSLSHFIIVGEQMCGARVTYGLEQEFVGHTIAGLVR